MSLEAEKVPLERNSLAKKRSRPPKSSKLHVDRNKYEEKYFPSDRAIIEISGLDATGQKQPWAMAVKKVVQSRITKPNKGVVEVRLNFPVFWKSSLSNMVHRRHGKQQKNGKDKMTPRTKDVYRHDSRTGQHEVIRFFSSCFCNECERHDTKPHIVIYFPLFSCGSLPALESKLGHSINQLTTGKVKQDLTEKIAIRRFFLYVVEGHHPACIYTASPDDRIIPDKAFAALQQLQDDWQPETHSMLPATKFYDTSALNDDSLCEPPDTPTMCADDPNSPSSDDSYSYGSNCEDLDEKEIKSSSSSRVSYTPDSPPPKRRKLNDSRESDHQESTDVTFSFNSPSWDVPSKDLWSGPYSAPMYAALEEHEFSIPRVALSLLQRPE